MENFGVAKKAGDCDAPFLGGSWCGTKKRLVVGDVNWPVHCTDLGAYYLFFCDQILSLRELLRLLQAGVSVQTRTYAVWKLRGQGLCSGTEREMIWLHR